MPSDDGLIANMIDAVRDLSRRLDEYTKAADTARDDLVEAWRIHRDVVNRAISYLNKEVIEFQSRLDKDDASRIERQKQIDGALEQITRGQSKIQHWQWVRLGLEVAAILIAAAYLYGVSR